MIPYDSYDFPLKTKKLRIQRVFNRMTELIGNHKENVGIIEDFISRNVRLDTPDVLKILKKFYDWC